MTLICSDGAGRQCCYRLKQFDCGHPFLNRFAQRSLKIQVKRSVATAYALLDTNQHEKVVGYYSLHAFALSRHILTAITSESLPHMVSVTRLGMLAIHKEYQHQRLGKRLLRHAMLKTLQASEVVGSKGLYLDAEQETRSADTTLIQAGTAGR
jgi:ribosomal protein S18 acetylase RimI-like enzyme